MCCGKEDARLSSLIPCFYDICQFSSGADVFDIMTGGFYTSTKNGGHHAWRCTPETQGKKTHAVRELHRWRLRGCRGTRRPRGLRGNARPLQNTFSHASA